MKLHFARSFELIVLLIGVYTANEQHNSEGILTAAAPVKMPHCCTD